MCSLENTTDGDFTHIRTKFMRGRCGHSDHADCNAGANIEAAGLEKLGPKVHRGQLKLWHDVILPTLSAYTGSVHVEGRMDVKGSCVVKY